MLKSSSNRPKQTSFQRRPRPFFNRGSIALMFIVALPIFLCVHRVHASDDTKESPPPVSESSGSLCGSSAQAAVQTNATPSPSNKL